jgi:hypothetical protein
MMRRRRCILDARDSDSIARMLARRAMVAIPAALVALLLGDPVREASAQSTGVQACTSLAEDGQRLRAAGKLLEAREKLMACSATECPQVVRVDCAQWASEVLNATPTIVLDVKDEDGNDVAVAKVFIDDQRVSDRIDGRPVAVNPGSRSIRIERSDGTSASQSIVAKENAKAREVKIAFSASSRATGSAMHSDTSSGAWGWQHYTGIALVAVGAIAMTWSTVQYLSYVNDEATLRDKFNTAEEEAKGCTFTPASPETACGKAIQTREALRNEYNANEKEAEDERALVLTAAVGGALLVAGGVTLFLIAPKSSVSAPPSVRGGPVITPGFAGMTLGGSF